MSYSPNMFSGGGSGTVTSVSGAGTVSGLTLTGTVTTAGSLTLGGTLSATSANISDFNSASRAQTEAELIAGANITITPAGAGAARTLTIAASGGGLSDGDKGDVTVSGGGTVWTIDAGVVTLAKQADMATASVVYRKTAGAGAPEVQTLATLKTDLGLTGTNSGDQTSIVGITGTLAEFNAALTGADFATGGGTATGTNTGDQTSVTGNAGTATALQTARNFSITGGVTAAAVSFNGTAAVVLSATVDAGHITLARMANLAANSIIGNNTGGAATPLALTAAQTKALLAIVAADMSDFNSATRAQVEAELVAGANITITPSGSGATRQLTLAASGGGGGGLAGVAVVTVPNSQIEWEETVAATGVTGTSKIITSLAPTLDGDENSADLLPALALAGTPGVNTITFLMAFAEPVAGPIKLNWSAF